MVAASFAGRGRKVERLVSGGEKSRPTENCKQDGPNWQNQPVSRNSDRLLTYLSITVFSTNWESAMHKAEVFQIGGDQAIRLPKEFRIDCGQVFLKKVPD